MSAARSALLALGCLAAVAHCRSPTDLLADVLSGGVGRLWRPWSRQDPSRGPDHTERLRLVSTDPGRPDEGLDFTQNRRDFRQVDREFSVFNHAAAAGEREDRRWGAGRGHEDWRRGSRPTAARQEGSWRRGGGLQREAALQQQRRADRPTRQQQSSRREGRLLSLLKLVRFEHFTCNATGGGGGGGSCFTARECAGMGGLADGECAQGYGVCCVFTKTCGDRITQNNTYFVNENYPGSYDGTGSCQVHIDKMHDNICQLRLDFDSFTLAQPESQNHICMSDQFSVTGSASTPLICGTNTGNHMYVDASGGDTPTTLNIVTSGASFSRSWKIRVSQIPCGTTYSAEPACLQYHTGVQGVIKSYNFDLSSGAQLSNQDYTVCVRTERNFCGIQYKPCDDPVNNSSNSFSLGGGDTPVGALTGDSCATDWVFIPCLTDNIDQPLTTMSDGNACIDRVCGDRFNTLQSTDSPDATLYSFVRPFRLSYHTDSEEALSTTSEANNRGFCLDYVQQPCTA